VKVATTIIDPGAGTPRFCTSNCTEKSVQASYVETLYKVKIGDMSGTQDLDPCLAIGYTLDPNLKYVDLKIRQGVQFHKGWGELTAEDVAFTFNDANRAVTPESISGQAGELAAMFLKLEVLDKYTVRAPFSVFDARWLRFRLSDFEESIGINPKAVFDKHGAEGMRNILIGTGPYQVNEWKEHDRVVLEAVPNHWRKTASVKTVTILEVREASAIKAMLETKEVAAGGAALKDWPDLIKKGFAKAEGTGWESIMNIAFSGNYWEKESRRDGKPVTRTVDITKPWVGNPYENGATYDEKTPSMQKALKVRLALAMAIDRKALNESLMAGLGVPAYFAYQPDTRSAEFKKGTWPNGWEYAYDVAKAKQLLSEAGYANGFTMDVHVNPEDTLGAETMEALAGFWATDLKIKVALERTAYVNFRPLLVQRTTSMPFLSAGDGNSINNPLDAARGFTMSTWSDGGYGVAMEIPFAADAYKLTAQNPDAATRIKANLDFVGKSIDWALCVGIVQTPSFVLYNPTIIAEWKFHPIINSGFNSMHNFEYIVLK
jgi:ABC-type transport system substrate-binding protein